MDKKELKARRVRLKALKANYDDLKNWHKEMIEKIEEEIDRLKKVIEKDLKKKRPVSWFIEQIRGYQREKAWHKAHYQKYRQKLVEVKAELREVKSLLEENDGSISLVKIPKGQLRARTKNKKNKKANRKNSRG